MTQVSTTTPREKVLKSVELQLNGLLDQYDAYEPNLPTVNEDTQALAGAIMSEFERLALGKEGDRLIFCDPDMPVDFIEA